ncbi:MAG: tetratricopeptide repeat protein [Elusimicrobia bacterium]|nr:tetratricopeptide repeat protein [Elusimicrobiota bacterium]
MEASMRSRIRVGCLALALTGSCLSPSASKARAEEPESALAAAGRILKEALKTPAPHDRIRRFEDRSWEPLVGEGDRAFGEKRYGAAARAYSAALKEADKLGPPTFYSALALDRLRLVYAATWDVKRLGEVCRRLVAMYDAEVADGGGQRVRSFPDLSEALQWLALARIEEARYPDAETHLDRALQIIERTAEAGEADAAGLEYARDTDTELRAIVRTHQGRHTEAESLYRSLLTSQRRQFGPESHTVAQTERSAAAIFRAAGKGAQADALQAHARGILEEAGLYGRERAVGPSSERARVPR